MSDIDFIDYDKISIQSDAFVTSDELNCYFQYIPSTKAISYNIKKELHTAGTTEDPDDYTIPDVSQKILPRKLFRINPFHKNSSENVELKKINTDPDILYPTKATEKKAKEIDYSSLGLNEDQIEFIKALNELKSLKVEENDSKLNIDEFKVTEEKLSNGFFQLFPRYMENVVSTSGGYNQFYDDTTTEMPFGTDHPLINENIKKLGLNPNEVNVKKKFEIRSGTVDKKEINNFLQDISLNDTNKIQKIENKIDYNEINLRNIERKNYQIISPRTSNYSVKNFATDINFANISSQNINQQIVSINKFSETARVDFDRIFKSFLSGLNLSSDIENQYFKTINQFSKNISFEFNRNLNLSEKTVYETNLRNLSTYYNFYRNIENRYREFIQNLNFFNETVQQIKQTELNLKNTYQNIHRHSVTYKNSHHKNIINLTKNVNYEYTENDYEFQNAVVKTIKNSNEFIENKITKIKEDLNLAQNNITLNNHKFINLQEKTSNYVNKEIKNFLNNTENIDDYSNIVISKISNISNNQAVKSLLSIVNNEDTLNDISVILRQSNINTDNIRNLIEVINYSKSTNFDITKVSNNQIENAKNFINFSNTHTKNFNFSKNITENLKTILDITEHKSFKNVFTSYNNLSKNLEMINAISVNPKISSITLNQKNIDNVSNIVAKTSSMNFDVKQLNYTIEKLSKVDVENINKKTEFLKQINFTKEDVTKKINFVNKISRFNKIGNLEEITNYSESVSNIDEFKNEIKNVKSLINLSKEFTNVNQQVIQQIIKTSSANNIINNISEFKNLNFETVQNINKISDNISSVDVQKISELINITKQTNLAQFKTSNISNFVNNISQIQKVSKIDNQDVINLINIQKQVQTKNFVNRISNVLQKTEMLDNINITNETTQSLVKIANTKNILELMKQISLTKESSYSNIQKINKITNLENTIKSINLLTNTVQQNDITKISKIEKKDLLSVINLSKIYNQDVKLFENKISNFSYRQKIKQNLQDINLVNNYEEKPLVQITNNKQSVQVKEFFQNLNILETENNTKILNRYSFESNKKSISNLFTELNLTQQTKQEKRIEKDFARISKRIDKLNKETIKVQGNTYKAEQNFFDMMNFYSEQKVSKTSNQKKINNFYQLLEILNIQKTNNEKIVNQKIQKVQQIENRIINNNNSIKLNVYSDKKDNHYKIENFQNFTTNNYHQEKEEQKKTEKIVENKVEELLVKKIENVTNNLVSNVITKNEFNTIKKEIIQEIFNIEMKTEERIKELRKETQQTVQTMLERFLRS
jgi:hypothetical protein